MVEPTGVFVVSARDKEVITSLLAKVKQALQDGVCVTVMSYENLVRILDNEEMSVIDRVYAVEPTKYGFRGPKFALESVPDNLVKVDPQPYTFNGRPYTTKPQFIPPAPYEAYRRMAADMQEQIHRPLLIASSYRSSAYQAIVFLKILKISEFDVPKTAKRAAIPGYSEHGTPSQLAFDFMNLDGLPSDATPQDFEGTDEYNWLVANAAKHDFYMSYPKDNPLGVMFEPWHWRHMPTS